MAGLLRLYLRALEKYPLRTQALSTGVLMGSGDMISQFAIEKKTLTTHDRTRTVRFFLFGTFIGGPILRGWYLTLNKLYGGGNPKTAAIKMMVTDQVLMAPTFCTLFISVMTYARTQSVTEVKDSMKQSFAPVMIANYKIWPAAQLMNFYLVPIQHRLMFVQFVALFWNTYLAWKTEFDQVKEQPDQSEPEIESVGQSKTTISNSKT